MKNILTSLFFSICCSLLHAQENRFIYLQTENRQPFFVKFNNKIVNSSPSGYLIIPKLNEGLYSLIIGFPGSTNELEFNCSVKNKDVGFIVKNGELSQWQLLNVQTLTVIIPADVITKPLIAYEKVSDPFSTMLANAVHDSTILRKDVATQISPGKSEDSTQTDSTNVVVTHPDVVLSKTAVTDSANKDIAKETQSEKAAEVIQKDSVQTLVPKSEPIIANSGEVLKTDSIKSDVAKEVSPETTDLTVKDSSSLTLASISKLDEQLKTDSVINKDVAKEILPENIGEITQKDTIRTEIPKELIVTNSKKKKSKKNDNALLDSSGTQTEVVKSNPKSKNVKDNSTENNDIALLRTSIKRRLKKNNKDGLEMMYIDDIGDTKDTIRVLIPAEKKKKKTDEIEIPDDVVSIPIQQDDKPKELVTDKKKAGYKISRQEKEIVKEAGKEPVFISTMINSDCKNFATEEDFLKTRKKLVAEKNDEAMIKAAKKIFKTKCFTTEQIKNISVLFLKDESKYMFFNAAYPFVSDSDLYAALEKQLTDNYYITRFRAMINK